MKQIDLGDCRRTTELLPWYANGTLDVEEKQRVQSHMETCAACRRELGLLAAIVESMPEQRTAYGGAPAFSQLLRRINKQEQRLQTWKMAAAIVVMLVAITAVALPVYLFQPRYETVTDAVTTANASVHMQLAFDTRGEIGTLTQLLEKYNAEVVSGPAADGTFLLEFELADNRTAQQLQQQLQNEPQVRAAQLWKPGK